MTMALVNYYRIELLMSMYAILSLGYFNKQGESNFTAVGHDIQLYMS